MHKEILKTKKFSKIAKNQGGQKVFEASVLVVRGRKALLPNEGYGYFSGFLK